MGESVVEIPRLNQTVAERHSYRWPGSALPDCGKWKPTPEADRRILTMPESRRELEADSRWPACFPSAICFASSGVGEQSVVERIVGASIVNRFPYVLAVSVCRTDLSKRHYSRRSFMRAVETTGHAAIQFLEPGAVLDRALASCAEIHEEDASRRLSNSGLSTKPATLGHARVFSDAYLIYEGRLVEPGWDFEGEVIFSTPWIDVGSHRVYFFEIQAIQLRQSIAEGREKIRWRSLPLWDRGGDAADQSAAYHTPPNGRGTVRGAMPSNAPSRRARNARSESDGFIKRYNPDYVFPSAHTVSFRVDDVKDGMAVQFIPKSECQKEFENGSIQETDGRPSNDDTRWPCFFPSSVGMITTWSEAGVPNVMPCGSTMVVSRHPFVIAPCVSYAAINERYAKRGTLSIIRKTGRFGCGVPYWSESIVRAIEYAGNISILKDQNKVEHAGLRVVPLENAPLLSDLPIHFDCRVVQEVRLGTHVMFLGEVERIFRHKDLSEDRALNWCPHPWVANASSDLLC